MRLAVFFAVLAVPPSPSPSPTPSPSPSPSPSASTAASARPVSDSVERVVSRIEDAREDPCRAAAAAGRPCFPAETRIKGEEYSVRKSLGLPDTQKDKPVAGTPPTLAEMGPYRPGLTATPINIVSFDPGCVAKGILKALKGRNDTYYLYRVRDIHGERVELYDRRLVAERFQGDLAFLGKFDGECAAIAAYRHESAKLPPPPAPRR